MDGTGNEEETKTWLNGALVSPLASEDIGEVADEEEKRVLLAAIDSFKSYRRLAHWYVTHRRRQNFYALPTAQWQLLAGPPFHFLESFDKVDAAIDANADIADEIVNASVGSFIETSDIVDAEGKSNSNDMDKARSTIRQFYRDWSHEGARERQASYGPIMHFLETKFPETDSRSDLRILIPGSGLGRLVYDVWKAGFVVQGNEISYHMLLASNWVLNHIAEPRRVELYPCLDFSNLLERSHQLQSVCIPDVHAASGSGGNPSQDRMSVTASDFIILYSQKSLEDTFDVVATVFFIDTAPNLIKYIETVKNCLKPGGYWVNNGPLHWHFADRAPPKPEDHVNPADLPDIAGIEAPGSFEMANNEVLLLLDHYGFQVETREVNADGEGYIRNPLSMLQSQYTCSFWVAKHIKS